MRSFLVALITCFLSFAAIPSAEASTLDRAEDAYSSGRYEEAARYYLERTLDRATTTPNASVYHNLGLAFDRQRQLGLAVAAYLRAVQLEPRQGDFRYNLQFLLGQGKDKLDISFDQPWYVHVWSFPGSYLSEREAFYLAVTLLLLFAIFMSWALLYPKRRRGVGIACFVTGFALALSLLGLSYKLFGEKDLGAVAVPLLSAYSGPTESIVIFELHEGAPFQVLNINGDWVKIQLSDQKQGWVKREGIASFGRKTVVLPSRYAAES